MDKTPEEKEVDWPQAVANVCTTLFAMFLDAVAGRLLRGRKTPIKDDSKEDE